MALIVRAADRQGLLWDERWQSVVRKDFKGNRQAQGADGSRIEKVRYVWNALTVNGTVWY
ncbi:hypothetical protein [Megasphaera massiliensis]|uniref:hypothetical protein n=1 Tax=Megasphaera massiliensis TaxID=1232428 RepID=UPI001CD3F1E8|nr:hypothetical protein [Megasphaera massiliensis]UBS53297.1 hypothetical protein LCQ47_10485 [Megasphaera massiliensis]